MDVVTFNWSALDNNTRVRIVESEQWLHGDTYPIDRWFARCYAASAKAIFVSGRMVIDFEITITKDKYMEFCLTWM